MRRVSPVIRTNHGSSKTIVAQHGTRVKYPDDAVTISINKRYKPNNRLLENITVHHVCSFIQSLTGNLMCVVRAWFSKWQVVPLETIAREVSEVSECGGLGSRFAFSGHHCQLPGKDLPSSLPLSPPHSALSTLILPHSASLTSLPKLVGQQRFLSICGVTVASPRVL